MDPITQAALGAATGHALLHRQLGTRALVLGAVAGVIPDIDTFFGALNGPFGTLVSHRGITHSLFFGPVIGSLAGWYWWRRERRRATKPDEGPYLWCWIALFVVALVSHPLLDWFTTFGTQLLAPFSRQRFALDAVAVVDPLYTLVLAAGIVFAVRAAGQRRAGRYTGVALLLSTAYLFLGLGVKVLAEQEARRQLAAEQVTNAEIRAYPTMLQLPHRRVVAITPEEIRVGFVSIWQPCVIQWGVVPRLQDDRVEAVLATREGRIYSWFANGQLAAEIVKDDTGGQRVRLVDLRYGYVPDPHQGLWGIDTKFDASGRMIGLPTRYTERPEVSSDSLARLLSDAFPASCRAFG